MELIIFALAGNEAMRDKLVKHLNARVGEVLIRQFPDGETYLQLQSDVKDKQVILVGTLHQPDAKLLPIYFFFKTARDLGAVSTCLVAPYLAYMRQDKRFQTGEAVTSSYFGDLVSTFADALITIDPHLHRRGSLNEVYNIPAMVGHAADHISGWIKNNIELPLLVGPDAESEQWVSEVANKANAPFIVLSKTRHGDRDVSITLPDVARFKDHKPILVDDIISTAVTMEQAIGLLIEADLQPPVCIGVHAVFAENAGKRLVEAGASDIITCNTIAHESNRIDVSDLLAEGFLKWQSGK